MSVSPPASKAPMSCSRRTAFATLASGGGSTALCRNCATLVCVLDMAPSSSFTCGRSRAQSHFNLHAMAVECQKLPCLHAATIMTAVSLPWRITGASMTGQAGKFWCSSVPDWPQVGPLFLAGLHPPLEQGQSKSP